MAVLAQPKTQQDTIPFRRRTSFSDVPKVSGQATRGRCLHLEMTQMGGVPQSVQYLESIDQLIVRQKKEILEVLTGFETCNRYEICNNMNQQLFFVQEESTLFERCCCAYNRAFQLHITDNNTQEVMRISREFRCCTGCCWCAEGCCSMELLVEAPVGRPIGKIRISNSKWKPHVEIMNAVNEHLFTIWGPCCNCQSCCCPADVDFPITDPSLTKQVGRIGKQWRGLCVEALTDADQYCLQFPMDMEVETKCLLIGSVFLLDFWIFEHTDES